jgi:hypothetical protein
VISPNQFRRGYHLSFIIESKQQGVLEFKWGWFWGRSAISIEASAKGKEAIVVQFPKGDLTGRTEACREEQIL